MNWYFKKNKKKKQEAHGPQRSPSYKSINTYDYHNVHQEKKKPFNYFKN